MAKLMGLTTAAHLMYIFEMWNTLISTYLYPNEILRSNNYIPSEMSVFLEELHEYVTFFCMRIAAQGQTSPI